MEEKFRQTATDILKVAFVGPESTGKTTISRALAEKYKTEWVPEFMRTYLQQKWDKKRELCVWDDLPPIAHGQMIAENKLIKKAKKFIFCDTNLLELMIYSYIYYGKCDPRIEKYALENQYDFIFLTNIDVPWVADDLRDKPNEREFMFEQFQQMLDKYRIPYIILEGNHDMRMQQVSDILANHQ
ncbi:MAG: ATP-binding protein [Capnocytophaga sp.]|nr:ATP-binding protein [Capnocytophaga sp.]